MYYILLGIGIFLLRTVDVSMGTLRTLAIVNGRMRLAFSMGFVEISIWLFVVAATLQSIAERPWLGLFYALGYSTGNVVGILVERRLPLGNVTLRIVAPKEGHEGLADELRTQGHGVTVFEGMGRNGPVLLIYTFMRKKALTRALTVLEPHPDAFYVVDYGGAANRVHQPGFATPTGWRMRVKKK